MTITWAQMFVYNCASNPTIKAEQGQMSDSFHLNNDNFLQQHNKEKSTPNSLFHNQKRKNATL